MLLYICIVYAAAAAYFEGLLLGSEICRKFGVRLTDARRASRTILGFAVSVFLAVSRRASRTILGVKISGRFFMWWAAQ